MVKSLVALSIFALFGASVIALPYASAGETAASAKGDRLDVRADCSQQVWPNISSSCLRGGQDVRQVRIVTAVRR
jgi:hypothetical protein